MSALTFRRSPTWSSPTAIERIGGRLRQAHRRLAEISLEIGRLDAESTDLGAFIAQLDALLQVEVAVRGRNAAPISDAPAEQAPSLEPSPSVAPPAFDLAAAVTHSGKRAYHREGRFFMPKDARRTGSTQPRRYDVSQHSSDPETLRLVKMIEVPGLIHAMVMAEKAQQVIDVDAVVVPEGALGINLSEAYRDHVFSVEAFNVLTDPLRCDDYLDRLRTGFIPPSEP